MGAIYKREFKNYFTSPLGYIFLAFMWIYSAYWFTYVLSFASSQIEYVFANMMSIIVILIPVLTMRLLSEEKKQKTDQLLLTAPVGIVGVVTGKYLAALTVYFISLLPTVLYVLILATFTPPNWNIFLGNFLALFLLGAAMIAIGLFISSLTESQIVAAIGSIAALMALTLVDSIAQVLPSGLSFLSKILTSISVMTRYNDFVSGILDVSHILFFLSVAVAFIFLTIRVLEKKRWS